MNPAVSTTELPFYKEAFVDSPSGINQRFCRLRFRLYAYGVFRFMSLTPPNVFNCFLVTNEGFIPNYPHISLKSHFISVLTYSLYLMLHS